ncbi:unnamed protein product [Hermetia illucens]|uniref:Gag protein n=1 Tax=Hermetia illucens TaxID=343691 RepID=A0A7R8UN98_HERIL|nr:unnamed protein product [Hermetia illucens]
MDYDIAALADISIPTMKLPKMSLSKFDGDYLQWTQLRNLFTELVGNQPISQCQKLWYLNSSVSGGAEKLIRHLSTLKAYYAIAWTIIKERYNNLRLQTTAFIDRLLSQTTIAAENTDAIKELRDTHTRVSSRLTSARYRHSYP